MSELETTTRPPSDRSPMLALAQWLALVVLAFGVVAVGMRWAAGAAEIPAPATESAVKGGVLDLTGPGRAARPPVDFRLASLDDGAPLGPPDFAGKVVLVEFWATWCGPCRLQAQFLEEIHGELAGKDVAFLAVDVGEDRETVERYVEKTPFPYPVLLDPNDSLSARYRIFGLPTVMIVDRQGKISYLKTGVSPADRLRYELKAAGAAV